MILDPPGGPNGRMGIVIRNKGLRREWITKVSPWEGPKPVALETEEGGNEPRIGAGSGISGKGTDSPLEPGKKCSLAALLILAPWDSLWTYELQKYNVISVCCLNHWVVVICRSCHKKPIWMVSTRYRGWNDRVSAQKALGIGPSTEEKLSDCQPMLRLIAQSENAGFRT